MYICPPNTCYQQLRSSLGLEPGVPAGNKADAGSRFGILQFSARGGGAAARKRANSFEAEQLMSE